MSRESKYDVPRCVAAGFSLSAIVTLVAWLAAGSTGVLAMFGPLGWFILRATNQ